MSPGNNFSDFLASSLHLGTSLRVYHVSTPPTSCDAIFAAIPGQQAETTTCESHFLTVSQQHVIPTEIISSHGGTNVPTTREDNEVLVLGIEVLIFNTSGLITVFVSKADSTGFLVRPKTQTADAKIQQGSPSIIKSVTYAFLEWLVSQNLPCRYSKTALKSDSHHPTSQQVSGDIDLADIHKNGDVHNSHGKTQNKNGSEGLEQVKDKRLVVSLFARSQNQYLFPGSIENEAKHVLDDRQLIKWWSRVLDGLVRKQWRIGNCNNPPTGSLLNAVNQESQMNAHGNCAVEESEAKSIIPEAFVVVPGCDRLETLRSFTPLPTKPQRSGVTSSWNVFYPTDLFNRSVPTPHRTVPVRCIIPRLPDDPKARYCSDLDTSGIDDEGQWRGVRTVDQFWEMMSYRQECSAGRLVGFLWVVFDIHTGLVVPKNAQTAIPVATNIVGNTWSTPAFAANDSTPTTENVTKPQADLDTEASKSTAVPVPQQKANTAQLTQDTPDAGSVKLTTEHYNQLADYLINTTDFAGIESAKTSTKGWITKVKELAGVTEFGITIEGRLASEVSVEANDSGPNDSLATMLSSGLKHARSESNSTPVNVLVGVRKKKRKVEDDANSNNGPSA